jgi:hypothetical protein
MKTEINKDYLLMILSSDWFYDFWWLVGIVGSETEKKLLQSGLRPIVEQIISGAKEYWLTDFSTERKNKTDLLMDSLIKEFSSSNAFASGLKALMAGKHGFLKHGSLETWEKLGSIDFVELSLKSQSAWDKYLRNLTPDTPQNLALFLNKNILGI